MPNHIHMILIVRSPNGRGDPSPTVDSMIGWLKFQITKEINQIRNSIGDRIFQRSFHDHIIRNRDDYDEIARYIHENPKRWKADRFYTE